MFGQKSLDLASGAATQAENICHPPQVRHPQDFFDESVDEVAYSVPHGAGGRLVQDKHLQQLGEQGAPFTIIAVYHFYHFIITSVPQRRSEERRVGKECRSRWRPYH